MSASKREKTLKRPSALVEPGCSSGGKQQEKSVEVGEAFGNYVRDCQILKEKEKMKEAVASSSANKYVAFKTMEILFEVQGSHPDSSGSLKDVIHNFHYHLFIHSFD